MKRVIFEDTAAHIEAAYSNLFLMAISKRYNLGAVACEIEKKILKYYERNDEKTFPKGFDGILFLTASTKLMGISFSDVMYLSEVEKRDIVYNLLSKIVSESIPMEDYDSNYNTGKAVYKYCFQDVYGRDSSYQLIFKKLEDDSKYIYTLEISIAEGGMSSELLTEYINNSMKVWQESSGDVADFIEGILEESKACEEKTSAENDANEQIEKDSLKGGGNEAQNELIDELILPSIRFMYAEQVWGRFEGVRENSPVYRRIVLSSADFSYSLKLGVGVHLVIERCMEKMYGGGISFTDFREHNASIWSLCRFLQGELSPIVSEYYEKDVFYRFKKPYLLRTTIRNEAIAYGNKCIWSSEFNDYVDLCKGDGKVQYAIVGAYISEQQSEYIPEKRIPMNSNEIKCIPRKK
jgi:hypothetical protein